MPEENETVGRMAVFDCRYINPDDAWIVDGVLQISKDTIVSRTPDDKYCIQITRMPHNYCIYEDTSLNVGGLPLPLDIKGKWPTTKPQKPSNPVDVQYGNLKSWSS